MIRAESASFEEASAPSSNAAVQDVTDTSDI
jgi:hypothetical protein